MSINDRAFFFVGVACVGLIAACGDSGSPSTGAGGKAGSAGAAGRGGTGGKGGSSGAAGRAGSSGTTGGTAGRGGGGGAAGKGSAGGSGNQGGESGDGGVSGTAGNGESGESGSGGDSGAAGEGGGGPTDGRVWDASVDFRVSPNEANPGPDSFGNSDIWHYLEWPVGGLSSQATYLSSFQVVTDTNRWQSPLRSDFHQIGRGTAAGSLLFAHPQNAAHAVIGWESPFDGTVRVAGSIRDGDTTCGNGVAWNIELGGTTVADGTASGSDDVPLDDPRLAAIAVETNDQLYLVISAAGEHSCDTTVVDFKVIEQL
jgi:hypothetical protein